MPAARCVRTVCKRGEHNPGLRVIAHVLPAMAAILSLASLASGQTQYEFEVIARTGARTAAGNTIIKLGTGPSINNHGKVAYIAAIQDGRQGLVVSGESDARSNLIQDFQVYPGMIFHGLSSNFRFGDVLEINDQDQVAWRAVARDGLFSFIFRLGSDIDDFRIVAKTHWDNLALLGTDLPSPFLGPFPYWWEGLSPQISLNNSGRVVFPAIPRLAPNGKFIATPRSPETSEHDSLSSYYSSELLKVFLDGSELTPTLYPFVADNDRVVLRGGHSEEAPIIVFMDATLNLETAYAIATSAAFNALGRAPGISDDGSVVAFVGDHKVEGLGIYVSGISGASITQPLKIAGIGDQFSNFSLEPRVGVNLSGSGLANRYTLAYIAFNPEGKLGLYTTDVEIPSLQHLIIWGTSSVTEAGGHINGLPGAVSNIKIYDPVNNTGQLAFWVQTDALQAIVRATADSDGDGLLDPWESQGRGIDIDGDGAPDYDLYSLGARPYHKDIFVEVDVMDMMDFPEDSKRQVEKAFKKAPVDNPDGDPGIKLHVLIDESHLPRVHKWAAVGSHSMPEGFCTCKRDHFGSEMERELRKSGNPNIIEAKKWAFRYAVICDRIAYSLGTPKECEVAGVSEIGGNDFAVAAGSLAFNSTGPDDERSLTSVEIARRKAGVFMHELGHTLGLDHGGRADANAAKPNYISVMNPILSYPQKWSDKFWRLDYSRGGLNELNESCLNEALGIIDAYGLYPNAEMPYGVDVTEDGQTRRETRYDAVFGTPERPVPIDWDGDGKTDEVSQQDLNYYPEHPEQSPGDLLRCPNDWDDLEYGIRTRED